MSWWARLYNWYLGIEQREQAEDTARMALGILMPPITAGHDSTLRLKGFCPELYETISEGRCPACRRRTRFLAGPSGGMSENIKCDACGYWFNVSPIGLAEAIGYKGERQFR